MGLEQLEEKHSVALVDRHGMRVAPEKDTFPGSII